MFKHILFKHVLLYLFNNLKNKKMETTTKTTWAIDPTHSEVGFKIKHMMISTVKGHFDSFLATVESNEEDFSDATVNVSIDIDSINTKNSERDAHLKSDDFFNSTDYPK